MYRLIFPKRLVFEQRKNQGLPLNITFRYDVFRFFSVEMR